MNPKSWLYRRSDFPHAAVQAAVRGRGMAAVLGSMKDDADLLNRGNLLLQAVITVADKTAEGQLVEAVTLPWFEIIQLIQREPDTIYQVDWRKWEEIIAGAYRRAGFDVVLTPRSNDKGRDVIASSKGIGSVRFVDQVKAYAPGNLVTADDVRALVGVLTLEPNVSKGILTTTSDFAPGVLRDPEIARLTPYRLELKARRELIEWITSVEARVRGNSA